MIGEWLKITWSNEKYRTIKEVNCHASELAEVLNLPFPPGAVVREEAVAITDFSNPLKWFRKKWVGLRVGETFPEWINQADRICKVLAIDDMGSILYDYEMPNGKLFHRVDGRPISEKVLKKHKKWQALLNA